MNHILKIVLLLVTVCPSFAVNCTWNFIFFTGVSNSVRRVEITPVTWGLSGSNLITADRLRYTNNWDGSLTVSNMVTNLNYRVEFYGPFATLGITNFFPAGTPDNVAAADYLVSSPQGSSQVGCSLSSTPYTRTFLESTNSNQARGILEVTNTPYTRTFLEATNAEQARGILEVTNLFTTNAAGIAINVGPTNFVLVLEPSITTNNLFSANLGTNAGIYSVSTNSISSVSGAWTVTAIKTNIPYLGVSPPLYFYTNGASSTTISNLVLGGTNTGIWIYSSPAFKATNDSGSIYGFYRAFNPINSRFATNQYPYRTTTTNTHEFTITGGLLKTDGIGITNVANGSTNFSIGSGESAITFNNSAGALSVSDVTLTASNFVSYATMFPFGSVTMIEDTTITIGTAFTQITNLTSVLTNLFGVNSSTIGGSLTNLYAGNYRCFISYCADLIQERKYEGALFTNSSYCPLVEFHDVGTELGTNSGFAANTIYLPANTRLDFRMKASSSGAVLFNHAVLNVGTP